MSRIRITAVSAAPQASAPLLDAVHKQLGMVPNLMKLLSASPSALEGYLSLNGALGKGALPLSLREQIALAIAQHNGCDYCLAAHSYLGKNLAKLSENDIAAARGGRASDATTAAALQFAGKVAQSKGHVADADLAALHAAGFDDAAALEIVAHVALNVLTNYVNNVAMTDLDFPAAAAR